jgi:glycosyltransferase involved in cell wall biosynthesis
VPSTSAPSERRNARDPDTLHVLFLYSTLTVGGAERQLALLVPALRDRGFETTVATLRHEGRYFEELRSKGIPMRFVGMQSRTDVAGAIRAYELWRLLPDVVFTSSIDAQSIGHALAVRAKARHVTAEHGGAGIPRAFHRRTLARVVAPRIDRVVAVSASQVPELLELGYPAPRISVIPNGIPAPIVGRDTDAVRAELEFSHDDVVAMFVATLRPEKRVDLFVRAVMRAHRHDPRLRGLVVGGGPELGRARMLTASAPDIVRVLGERSDVADLIAASDVVCLTSSFEGLPMTVLEAMGLGRPVLAMNVGGIPEAVTVGKTGWLTPAGDVEAFSAALVDIAGAPAERRALGQAARLAFAERYTVERMVDRYAQLLDDLKR